MSGENDGYAVGVEMDELGEGKEFADLDCQPVEEKTVAEVSFRVRFESILMDYSDEKTWWVAVENLPKKDSDFAEKVSCNSVCIQLYTPTDYKLTHNACRLWQS